MTPDGTYAYVTVLGADRVDSTAASVTWDFYGHGTVVSTTPTVDTQFTS
jgi:extradiol dioxygenase family protein